MPGTDALDEIPLDLRVELGRTTLSVADLLRLVPGDVLTLSRRADEPLPVHAGDRLLFDARPGASGRHVALQILSLYAVRPDAEDE
jgi:flagellar motor switch protein FliM